MNKPTRYVIPMLALLAFVGCDTVEDSFIVGDKPKDSDILRVEQDLLTFKPEGESKELKIASLAQWEVSIADNSTGRFSVSPSSGKGDATVVISCRENPLADFVETKLTVSALNLDKAPVTVTLRQINTSFYIADWPSSDIMAEEGGTRTMTAYSSLDWQLEVVPNDAEGNKGDIGWLTIVPGISGEGNYENRPINFSIKWSPNYEENDRVINLQFKPAGNMTIPDQPQPFTLRQQAGTLPQNIDCNLLEEGPVDLDITLKYSSRSPVRDCGVRLYRMVNDNETLFDTYRPGEVEYQKEGNYRLSVKDLPEESKFRIEPFVQNEVGTKMGLSLDHNTGTKPENMVYNGVEIVDADSDGIKVTTDMTSAIISFTVMSDVEPLDPDRIESVIMTVNGNPIFGMSESNGSGIWNYEYRLTDLNPNQEYHYTIEVIGKPLPREQGQVTNNSASYSGKWKTNGMTPDFGDNIRPDIEK